MRAFTMGIDGCWHSSNHQTARTDDCAAEAATDAKADADAREGGGGGCGGSRGGGWRYHHGGSSGGGRASGGDEGTCFVCMWTRTGVRSGQTGGGDER